MIRVREDAWRRSRLPAGAFTAPEPLPRRLFSHTLRLSLAGAHIGNTHSRYDPQERYFLIATGDCDGAYQSLILTPRPASEGIGWGKAEMNKLPRVALPRLRTGKGININNTPLQVQRKLGKAPDFFSYDRRRKERIYEYRATLTMPAGPGKTKQMQYRGVYKFLNELLWSISYHLSKEDGCD